MPNSKYNRNGLILWEGDSPIDGQPIVVIATGFYSVANKKTGSQPTVWIMRSDIAPTDAMRTEQDYSVCGECPRRGTSEAKRSCYVLLYQAPTQLYLQYKSGRYKHFDKEVHSVLFKNRSIRFGGYGDPSLIPQEIIQLVLSLCEHHTAFTRQWLTMLGLPMKGIAQASCNSIAESIKANKLGFKVYLSLPIGSKSPVVQNIDFIECPHQSSGGTVQCINCNLCDGNSANVWCYDHGRYKARKLEVLEV